MALKKKKKDNAEQDITEQETGGKGIIALIIILIIVIWLIVLGFLINRDVGGFGSNVLYPVLKDVPVINQILPEPSTEDTTQYPYATLEDAMNRINELESQLAVAQSAQTDNAAYVADLEQRAQQLEEYKANEAEFEDTKQKFDEQVVFADNAPDIEEYKEFYEQIEPANAESLYKQTLEQLQQDQETQDYVKIYSAMKPKQAAAIFDTMTSELELVAQILTAMSAENSSAILGLMNADTAARLTQIMNPSE
ncbi:MAG: MotE family protein [Lachnospiraceae bacterium]